MALFSYGELVVKVHPFVSERTILGAANRSSGIPVLNLLSKRFSEQRVFSGSVTVFATRQVRRTGRGPAVRSDSLLEQRRFELPVFFGLFIFREGL
jgi:hypothetical protein